MPLSFTVEYDDLTNDVDDTTGDVGTVAVMGPMYFEPTFAAGHRIPALENLPRPAGLAVRAFPAFLDGDGQLKTEAGGTVGVRLWANDPDWGLHRFQYRVRALLTDQLGREVQWNTFYFDAPSEDVVVNLAREMPRPGQSFGRGRSGFGVGDAEVNGFGQLVITREDGAELGTVTIPELSDTLNEASAQSIAYVMTFGR